MFYNMAKFDYDSPFLSRIVKIIQKSLKLRFWGLQGLKKDSTGYPLVQKILIIFFSKLARPKNRAKTVQFSKQAVICERDGELCLIVRAVNLRASLLIDVSVTGEFIWTSRLSQLELVEV